MSRASRAAAVSDVVDEVRAFVVIA